MQDIKDSSYRIAPYCFASAGFIALLVVDGIGNNFDVAAELFVLLFI